MTIDPWFIERLTNLDNPLLYPILVRVHATVHVQEHAMKFAHEVMIPASADAINLPDWLFGLSEEDYAACQRGHRAIGVLGDGARAGMVNVESIGGSLMVQHYATHLAEAHHVTMVSKASRAYLMHVVPVALGVVWDMSVVPEGASARFRCEIDVDLPLVVRALGLLSATPYFVRRHLIEETHGFARDSARKSDASSERAGDQRTVPPMH